MNITNDCVSDRRLLAAVLSFSLALGMSAVAHAEETDVSIAASQFTDKVESSKPVGDVDAAAHAKVVTYYVEVANKKAPTEITLVWKRDGKEIVRQHLDVGTSPRWRTWGMCPTSGAKEMEIEVLDASGNVLKSDTLAIK
jgi:hypothetical protein